MQNRKSRIYAAISFVGLVLQGCEDKPALNTATQTKQTKLAVSNVTITPAGTQSVHQGVILHEWATMKPVASRKFHTDEMIVYEISLKSNNTFKFPKYIIFELLRSRAIVESGYMAITGERREAEHTVRTLHGEIPVRSRFRPGRYELVCRLTDTEETSRDPITGETGSVKNTYIHSPRTSIEIVGMPAASRSKK